MATAPDLTTDLHPTDCMISLLFAADRLPHPADIFALADADDAFFVAHDLRMDGDPAEGLELLVAGLTFDCLWPGPSGDLSFPDPVRRFDLPEEVAVRDLRPLHLVPGAHLSGGVTTLPVAQEALALAARLCALPGFVAAVWHPSGNWIGPGYLGSIAAGWSEGGIFPAHALIGLVDRADGSIESEGLGFFTGQDLRIEAELLDDRGMADKIASRLVDRLIGDGRIDAAMEIMGPDGRMLRVAPSSNGRMLRVWGGG